MRLVSASWCDVSKSLTSQMSLPALLQKGLADLGSQRPLTCEAEQAEGSCLFCLPLGMNCLNVLVVLSFLAQFLDTYLLRTEKAGQRYRTHSIGFLISRDFTSWSGNV